MMWVVDASVAVKWFLIEDHNDYADQVLKRLVDNPELFAVPELFTFEVFSVLARLHPNALHTYREGVLPLLQGGIFRYPMTGDLATKAYAYTRKGLAGYDACYAALAEELDGQWLTFDEKAHRLIASENVSVLVKNGLPHNWY
jgi:predicted nucleic acid-binding protein